MHKNYSRNRIKDFIIIILFGIAIIPILPIAIIAIIPILPIAIIVFSYQFIEKFADWYDGIFIHPLRELRDKWNPEK